jgi:hypothetical protein
VAVVGVGQDRPWTEAAAKRIDALVGRGLPLRICAHLSVNCASLRARLRFIKGPIAPPNSVRQNPGQNNNARLTDNPAYGNSTGLAGVIWLGEL